MNHKEIYKSIEDKFIPVDVLMIANAMVYTSKHLKDSGLTTPMWQLEWLKRMGAKSGISLTIDLIITGLQATNNSLNTETK